MTAQSVVRQPLSPYAVLAIAILLPGFGYTAVGRPGRGLTMQLFMLSLAFVTWQLTTPAQSLIGRLAGGLFIYALSLPECYRLAKVRRSVYAPAASLTPSI